MIDRPLERGDIVRSERGTIWFVEEVGGQELVQVICLRPAPEWFRQGDRTTMDRQATNHKNVLLGQAIDYDHAMAIIALKH